MAKKDKRRVYKWGRLSLTDPLYWTKTMRKKFRHQSKVHAFDLIPETCVVDRGLCHSFACCLLLLLAAPDYNRSIYEIIYFLYVHIFTSTWEHVCVYVYVFSPYSKFRPTVSIPTSHLVTCHWCFVAVCVLILSGFFSR